MTEKLLRWKRRMESVSVPAPGQTERADVSMTNMSIVGDSQAEAIDEAVSAGATDKELARMFNPSKVMSSVTHQLRADKDNNVVTTRHDRQGSDCHHAQMGYDATDAWWHYNGSYEAYVADVGKRKRWANALCKRRSRAKKVQT